MKNLASDHKSSNDFNQEIIPEQHLTSSYLLNDSQLSQFDMNYPINAKYYEDFKKSSMR